MLERRTQRRRRVCLEAQLMAGLTGCTETVRVRNLANAGAEIAGAGSRDKGMLVGLRLCRGDGVARMGRVSWSKADRFGVAFLAQENLVAGANAAPPRLNDIAADAGSGA